MIERGKLKCEECGWKGLNSDMLTAQNPFDTEETIFGCPRCLSIDSCVGLCDEQGCNELGSCGTPSSEGYRWTCHKHVPKPIVN